MIELCVGLGLLNCFMLIIAFYKHDQLKKNIRCALENRRTETLMLKKEILFDSQIITQQQCDINELKLEINKIKKGPGTATRA